MTFTARLAGATALALVAIAGAATAADDELLVFDWSGFEEPDFYSAYTEKYGEPPSFAFFGEEEEAFQKLRSGFRADVSHPCPHSVDKWRQAGLIEPWDISKIPNYATVDEAFKTAEVLTDNGDVYFIPADNGATAIAWNTEKVPAEDVSTLQVFLDPKYAQRIALLDNVDDAFALGFLATGVTDWTKATAEDVDRAADWLRKVHPNVRAYWADGAELAQLMGTGEVLIAWSWNETPVGLVADGQPIAFNREPVEGSSMWFCGYVNLKDGPGSEDKAHDFVNAWLEPSVTEYIVTEWGYGHANTEAMKSIPAETLEEVGMGPVDVPVLHQVPLDLAIRERMVEAFERIKAGF